MNLEEFIVKIDAETIRATVVPNNPGFYTVKLTDRNFFTSKKSKKYKLMLLKKVRRNSCIDTDKSSGVPLINIKYQGQGY
ncbi:hypothetical protein SPPR111872_04330 [Sphingobacterium prati]